MDRHASNALPLTHECIGGLMGVRRESVTEAVSKLKIAGCIGYERGHLSVLDRSGLEDRSCECYRVAKRETDRLLEMSVSGRVAVTQSAVDRVRGAPSEPSARRAVSSIA
jgi:hypothetical protein